ncbi:ABC transporter ATP-binding protein [Falsiroseomonas selenitidurans]|uniref:ABC transporter ATP-binding protein n=1 Tax=Falsiroseomonas selenitidurans TaxID=2716335 RepID=A0ABX1E7D0_9PROT|nr:ABC transporter ATP-binding protein [Falsiroseomonas selenitidurans]NKC32966.1 ABC transporter ATP-binding protein [Falsiroseomonas selenitidurans]
MQDALVRFESVSKVYAPGGPAALAPLDLTVARGELLTLLGPSGSGKSTTLMLLAGFEAPSAGRILLEGRDIGALPPHRRGIGVVFQSYALFPHMTAAENIAFPLEARFVPKPQQAARVARALAMVRLEGLGDRRPAQLSGGQQQRVALARALVFEPPVVLLDEPLGALDKALREEMQAEIRALHRRLGVTMLYVTHDQAEALALSDRIAVFRAGRLHQLAPPRRLYDQPADAFVAGFIGESNLLPGIWEAGGRVRLAAGPLVPARPGEALADGAPCLLLLRPEQLALDAAGLLAAEVAELVFQGDHVRLRLVLADGAPVSVKAPLGARLPAPGEAVRLTWPAGAALAFRAGAFGD